MENNKSRRQFIRLGLTSAAVAPLAAVIPFTAQAEDSPLNILWDEEMDVLVLGTGMAGFTAAIKAAETTPGLKIVLADKMSRLGGSSLISGLNMAVVGSPWQKEAGVLDDSWELLLKDIEKESRGYSHIELTKTIAQNTLSLFNFLCDHGVEFDKTIGNGTGIKSLGGHSRARCVWPVHGGSGIVKSLQKYIQEKLPNIDIRKQVLLEEIIRNPAGRVIGVRVRENYVFNREVKDFGLNDSPEFNSTGNTRYYKVKRGLVIATGGYNQDRKFRGDEVGALYNSVSTANPGATAGALKAMIKAGFKPIHMTLFRFAFPIPTEDILWGILVNPRTCQRFVDEYNNNDRQGLGLKILSERMKIDGEQIILIYDQTGVDNYHDKQRLTLSLEGKNGTEGTMWKFDTLEALAANFNMDIAELNKTIAEYNQNMENDKDQFGKPKELMKTSTSIGKAPYYAMWLNPRYNYSQGGAMINTEARPLDIVTQQPIPGAFVCGEASAGSYGYIRLTACGSLDCGVFGMIAGENAGKETPWE
ncbi:Fumarate reductase flavoprotein subunit precursor [Leminorella richardii]|uniref:Fumarate reductase flavoprotein subunit n=1 Tax=Leminorella richardii TaxID=158841 RepID=A0A2X4UUR0_9GAMM|nr:FAD-binding protein [Leminorella richardii]SQI42169.1 Fumarate reductase flavoprotein subunit precursor [Leminorella richardii]